MTLYDNASDWVNIFKDDTANLVTLALIWFGQPCNPVSNPITPLTEWIHSKSKSQWVTEDFLKRVISDISVLLNDCKLIGNIISKPQ